MEALRFTEEQSLAYRQVLAPEATDVQWNYFRTECERRSLVPGTHVVFQIRYSNEFDRQLQREVSVAKVTLVTTINALRLIALRSGKYKGHTPFEYHYMSTTDNVLSSSKIPLGQVPHAVSASFYREGWVEALFATARFDAYKQTKSGGGLTRMWATRSEEQLAKCCEAAGLRTVAPEECGGLYLAEEFGDDPTDKVTGSNAPAAAPVQPPAPITAPVVNQTAAVTTPEKPVEPVQAASSVSSPVVTPVKPVEPVQTPVVDVKPVVTPPAAAKPTPPAPKPTAPRPPAAPKPAQTAPAAPTTPAAAPQPTPAPITTAAQAQAAVAADVQREAEQLTPAEAADLKRAMDTDRPPTKPVVLPAGTPAPAAPVSGDAPATAAQYNDIIRNRATKLVRDKLDKVAGAFKPTEAGRMLLAYMLKASGQTDLRKASAAKLEQIVAVLEAATPEDAVKLVKGA